MTPGHSKAGNMKYKNEVEIMEAEIKYLATGSGPYYINLNSTAKDFSIYQSTNPEFGLLESILKVPIIETPEYYFEESEIIENVVIGKGIQKHVFHGIEFLLEIEDGYSLQHEQFPVLSGFGEDLSEAENALSDSIKEMYFTLSPTPDYELGSPNLELKQFLIENFRF